MNDKVKNTQKIISNLFSILATIILVFSITLGIHDYLLEQNAVNINATITTLDYSNGSYSASIKYKVNDKTYKKVISLSNRNKLTVKDQVKIKYDINNPDRLIYNNHIVIITICSIVAIILYILFLPTAIKNLNLALRINRLKKKGFYIDCNITEVFINTHGKRAKGNLPYKLRCLYINPMDNKEYIFDSEDTYINLEEVIKQYNNTKVTVYLNKENTFDYYVDLTSLFPKINLVDMKEFMKQSNNNNNDNNKE